MKKGRKQAELMNVKNKYRTGVYITVVVLILIGLIILLAPKKNISGQPIAAPPAIHMTMTANGQIASSDTPLKTLLISSGDSVQVAWRHPFSGGPCRGIGGAGGTGSGTNRPLGHWTQINAGYYPEGGFTSNPITSDTIFTIECSRGGQTFQETLSVDVPPHIPPPQINYFSAIPSTMINLGSSTALAWDVTGAVYCQGTGGLPNEVPSLSTSSRWTWGPAPNRMGTSTINPGDRAIVTPSRTATYTLECFSANGRSSSSTTTVTILTPVKISAFTFTKDKYVAASNTVQGKLSWNTQYASGCTMRGGAYGAGTTTPIQGKDVIITAVSGTEYTLDCRGSDGSAARARVTAKN